MQASRFPQRLRNAIGYDGTENKAIWWNKSGKSFTLYPDYFEVILKASFDGNKFQSFTRKLNRWGFRRTIPDSTDPPGSMAFGHQLFLRDQPQLQKKMTGVSTSSKNQNRPGQLQQPASEFHHVRRIAESQELCALPNKRRRTTTTTQVQANQHRQFDSALPAGNHKSNLQLMFQEQHSLQQRHENSQIRSSFIEQPIAARMAVLDQMLLQPNEYFFRGLV